MVIWVMYAVGWVLSVLIQAQIVSQAPNAKHINSDPTPSTIEFATAVNFIEDWGDPKRNKDGLLEFSGSINCNVAPTIA